LIIGVDLMGSDTPPQLLLAELMRLSLPAGVELRLIGDPSLGDVVPAPETIAMDEHPLLAVRKKKRSSMSVGCRLLKEGAIGALVSAGNTGALMAAAKTILSTEKGILRPALVALMPTKQEPMAVLDVGANVQVSARHLVQFAHLGVAYQKRRGKTRVRVGLLNIGEEPMKGTTAHREAYQALQKSDLDFIGNIEAKEAFYGHVDVLVTDGFTGNVFIKTAEGMAHLLNVSPKTQCIAPLLGVNGIVVKCHSYAKPEVFCQAVMETIGLIHE
jgi:phosphate acyltransferase